MSEHEIEIRMLVRRNAPVSWLRALGQILDMHEVWPCRLGSLSIQEEVGRKRVAHDTFAKCHATLKKPSLALDASFHRSLVLAKADCKTGRGSSK